MPVLSKGGKNLPLVGIGLTDLTKIGGGGLVLASLDLVVVYVK
jgi:hypothetical protein